MEHFNLSDYLTILRRRYKTFLALFGVLFAVSCLFALSWSNYRAEATVEIAPGEILTSYTSTQADPKGGSIESLVDLHISRLQQKVLSTGSLIEIITKFNLYPTSRVRKPMADLAEEMRQKIKIKLVGSALANPASAQKASAGQLSAIAFVLSFDYDDAATAQIVTNELVSRFLDEDARQRRSKAQETTAFLDSQLKVLEDSLAEQEKKIAEFRAANGDVRPEALSFNQQVVVSTQMALQNIDAQIAANLGTQGALRAQLAATDPYARLVADGRLLSTPSAQLKALKAEQAALTARYGAAHPDVVKINRQVDALEKQAGPINMVAPLKAQITDSQARLAALRERYGTQSPDVKSLESQLSSLQRQLRAEQQNGTSGAEGIVTDADNPSYLQIVAQLRAASEQHRALTAQREELSNQQVKYKSAIVQNPVVEQQLAALMRDYDNAQLRYRELKANKLAAAMNETIEQDRTGQRLAVIDPPALPSGTQPARFLFLFAGLVLALGGGMAGVLSTQYLSQSVIGVRHMEALTGIAPLVEIPHIATHEETAHFKQQKIRMAVAGVLALLLCLTVFSYAVMPLDVLGAVIARHLGF